MAFGRRTTRDAHNLLQERAAAYAALVGHSAWTRVARRAVSSGGEFVVNVPAFEPAQLQALCVAGLDFAPGVDELEHAGLTPLPAVRVRPPRVAEFSRHFECVVVWTRAWWDRLIVVGDVVAASCTEGHVDSGGEVLWDVARPAHYCGWPYGRSFVPAYEVVSVGLQYDGPEAHHGERRIPEAALAARAALKVGSPSRK